jgi:serine protease Do
LRVFGPNMSLDTLRALLKEFDREQYGTQRWITITGRLDSLFKIPMASNAAVVVRGMFAGEPGRQSWDRMGWLGMSTQGPNRQLTMNGEVFVTQFAYPLIVTVDPQSPAEKAGIVAGDVLVAYNGIDVVNHEFNLTTLLKPESKVAVTVRRDGETKEFQLVAARAPRRVIDRRAFEAQASAGAIAFGRGDMPDGPQRKDVFFNVPTERGFTRLVPASPLLVITPNGVFGANLSTVNNELARKLNLRAGVLVMDVPEDSPAFRAGLRIGDVITAVGDQPVISLSELRQRAVMLSREHAIQLQVTSNNQKTRTVTVNLTPPAVAPPSP